MKRNHWYVFWFGHLAKHFPQHNKAFPPCVLPFGTYLFFNVFVPFQYCDPESPKSPSKDETTTKRAPKLVLWLMINQPSFLPHGASKHFFCFFFFFMLVVEQVPIDLRSDCESLDLHFDGNTRQILYYIGRSSLPKNEIDSHI